MDLSIYRICVCLSSSSSGEETVTVRAASFSISSRPETGYRWEEEGHAARQLAHQAPQNYRHSSH
ncbi:hypothetical protein LIA77_06152 [Sarocladium implicatum]|nr:hypothetical protein LIA77_06152 [Sarocladium implicatum]